MLMIKIKVFILINKNIDFYQLIHDTCIKSKKSFDNTQIKILSKTIKSDGIINNSIFLD